MSADNVTPKRRATDWRHTSGLTEHEDYSVTLSNARHFACLSATWEVERLALNLMTSELMDESDPNHLVLRGLAGRIRSMSRVIISVLSDDSEPLEHLEREVFGTAQKATA
jgi:hypothetical protein